MGPQKLSVYLVVPQNVALPGESSILDCIYFWKKQTGSEVSIEVIEEVGDARLALHRGGKQVLLFVWPSDQPPSARDRNSLRFIGLHQTCLLAMPSKNIASFCYSMREFYGRVLQLEALSPEILSSGLSDLETQVSTSDTIGQFSLTDFAGLLGSRFTSSLKDPLKLIADSVQALEGLNLEPNYERPLRIVRDATGMLLFKIMEILDQSSSGWGNTELTSRVFSLRTLLRSVEAVLALRASMSETEFLMVIEDSVPATAYGDPERLGQALLGYVEKCLTFSPRGGILIFVEADKDTQGSYTLRISASNHGVKINKIATANLSNRAEVEQFIVQYTGGSPDEIRVLSELIEKLGGSLSVRSEEKKGTLIRLTLPLTIKDLLSLSTSSADAQRTEIKRQTILVVDDNEINRRLLTAVLAREGHAILAASNGAEAVALYEKHEIDVVLMDLDMPVLDGISASKKIRVLDRMASRYTPIIIVTTHRWEEIWNSCQDAGIDGFVPKPVNFDQLRSAISAALQCREVINEAHTH